MSIRAQDDFDNFVNAEWKKKNPIPDKYPRYTNFTFLSEMMDSIMKKMCENTNNVLINSVYNLYLTQTEKQFKEHVHGELNKIITASSKDELIENTLEEIKNGKYYLLHIYFSGTCRNPKFQIPNFSLSGISLPDKSYYTDKAEFRNDFKEMITNIFKVLDLEQKHVNKIWDIEAFIAEKHYSKAEKRDPLKTYHPTTLKQFIKSTRDKFACLKSVLPENIHDITINNDELPQRFVECFEKYSLAELKTWLAWKVVRGYVSSSIHECYKYYFDFYSKKLSGTKASRPLDERAMLFTKSFLGDEFSKIYVETLADPKLKTEFPKFVKKIKQSVKDKLVAADWMEHKTKKLAIDKLENMKLKIIGPSKYEDYSFFAKDYRSVFAFIDAYSKWDWNVLEIERKMYKLHDPETWEMDSVDINAYYHPYHNEIVFPAAILQAPFYSSDYSFGENAGGIGAVIAHEITHGFDDKGSKYDKLGYLREWWSKTDRKKYEDIIAPMENYFNKLIYNNKTLNGRLTQGENLADLGGMKCALAACDNDANKKMCIYAWARTWRANVRDKYAEQMIIVDPHSLPHFRINGILAHISDFYRLFNVTKSDKMYIDVTERCSLYD